MERDDRGKGPYMRVMTMNVWGRRGSWAERRAVLREGIAQIRPDLVAFQEVIRTEKYDQALDLLGTEFHLAHQQDREPAQPPDVEEGQGVCIASRWPITDIHEVDLQLTPRTAGFACTTLAADIDAPHPMGRMLFLNHLPSWKPRMEHERELQAVATAEFIEDHLGEQSTPVILAGDLDAQPEAASIRFWTGRQSLGATSVCYIDAWDHLHPTDPGHTLTPSNPLTIGRARPERIDYIFVRCSENGLPTLKITTCQIAFEEPVHDVWASDHYGLLADLEPTP